MNELDDFFEEKEESIERSIERRMEEQKQNGDYSFGPKGNIEHCDACGNPINSHGHCPACDY